MLNPKNLANGQEQYEKYRDRVTKKTRYAYGYRHIDGELFSCVKLTLEACRAARDEWLNGGGTEMIATKEQERNTLEKIKKMVAELGENSYLAAAFTGAFELAEQNIENDWGLTTQEYIDKAVKAGENENRARRNLPQSRRSWKVCGALTRAPQRHWKRLITVLIYSGLMPT